jgi:hypothetical protein
MRVKFLDLAALPRSEQLAAARLQALAWAPFDDPVLRLVLRPGRALVFAWDAALLANRPADGGADLLRRPFIPEILLRDPVQGVSARLVQTLDGVEGQCWRDGMLHASRWWPQAPDLVAWQHFLRSSGSPDFPADADRVPSVVQAPWRRRPWAAMLSVEAASGRSSRAERLLVAGLGLVAVAALAGQVRQAVEQHQRERSLQVERDTLRGELDPLLAQRTRALATSASARRLAQRLDGADPLGVMVQLARVLPADGVRLREFALEGRSGRIVLDVTGPVSRSSLVSALQAGGLLTGVTETTEGVQRGWVGFTFAVNSLDLAPASGAAAPAGDARPSVPAAVGAPPVSALDGQPGSRP